MSSLTRRASLLTATLGASLMVCTGSALALNPQPLPPRHEAFVLGHTMLNPQPLPPRR